MQGVRIVEADHDLRSAVLRNIRTGDTIVFDSVSSMSQNADEGFRL